MLGRSLNEVETITVAQLRDILFHSFEDVGYGTADGSRNLLLYQDETPYYTPAKLPGDLGSR